MDNPTQYYVMDRKTKKPVGKPYKNKNRARTRVDQLDNIYGGYRYYVSDNSGFIV